MRKGNQQLQGDLLPHSLLGFALPGLPKQRSCQANGIANARREKRFLYGRNNA